MTAALAPVAPKLGKLVLLLSSPNCGEVVAAAAAIGRTLDSAGATWHDLAAALIVRPAPEPQRAAPPAPSWFSIVQNCLRYPEALTPRERAFLRDVSPRIAGNSPTAKQAAWINAIRQKIRAEYGE